MTSMTSGAVSHPGAHADTALASRFVRLVASLIDSVVMFAPLAIGVGGMFLLVGSSFAILLGTGAESLVTQLTGSFLGLLSLALIAVGSLLTVGLIAYQWFLVTVSGQTIGKRLAGVRIVKVDGSPCGFVAGVLLRSIAFGILAFLIALIPYVGQLLVALDLAPIFGRDRRCVHDYIAGTKVVWASERSGKRWIAVVAALGIVSLGTVGFLYLEGIPTLIEDAKKLLDDGAGSDVQPPPPPGATPPGAGAPPATQPPAPPPPPGTPTVKLLPVEPPTPEPPTTQPPTPEPPTPEPPSDNPPGGDEKSLFTYVDDEGQFHIVDRLELVPARYRDRVKTQ